MKPTIQNKLIGGFTAMMIVMAVSGAIGIYSLVSLRGSALNTARVGDRLDSISLEIQVHSLEAQRMIHNYLAEFKQLGPEKARQTYLDEAQFEIHEIDSLAAKAVALAPTSENRTTFQAISAAAKTYSAAVASVVDGMEKGASQRPDPAALSAYSDAAEKLSESAEDGELAGRDASQRSIDNIERISKRAVPLVIAISFLGFLLGLGMCIVLYRAIFLPLEHLKNVAENVSLGNLTIDVKRFSDDEIGDLTDSFSRLVTAVRFFQAEAIASEALMEGRK